MFLKNLQNIKNFSHNFFGHSKSGKKDTFRSIFFSIRTDLFLSSQFPLIFERNSNQQKLVDSSRETSGE